MSDPTKQRFSGYVHGMFGTPEYWSWSGMIQRCTNPRNPAFHNYGGRGIKVCKRWLKFENFFADLGLKPSPKHTLDRINNSRGYSPDNCQWATWKEQNNNRRPKRTNPWVTSPEAMFAGTRKAWTTRRAKYGSTGRRAR